MKLSRNDRSRVILGALIALVIFVAAVSPAHCQSTPMASCSDGNNDRAGIDLAGRMTKKERGRPYSAKRTRTVIVPAAWLEIIV